MIAVPYSGIVIPDGYPAGRCGGAGGTGGGAAGPAGPTGPTGAIRASGRDRRPRGLPPRYQDRPVRPVPLDRLALLALLAQRARQAPHWCNRARRARQGLRAFAREVEVSMSGLLISNGAGGETRSQVPFQDDLSCPRSLPLHQNHSASNTGATDGHQGQNHRHSAGLMQSPASGTFALRTAGGCWADKRYCKQPRPGLRSRHYRPEALLFCTSGMQAALIEARTTIPAFVQAQITPGPTTNDTLSYKQHSRR